METVAPGARVLGTEMPEMRAKAVGVRRARSRSAAVEERIFGDIGIGCCGCGWVKKKE